MFRPAVPAERTALVSLGEDTGIFQPGEPEALLGGVLDELFAGRLGDGHQVQVWADDADASPVGWTYLAPNDKSEGVWDLWWIGVIPDRQGQGIGGDLLRSAEAQAREAGGRLLIVETSSSPRFDSTRRFYARHDYIECGTVPDFYAVGEGKVIFAKRLSSTD